jgi:hypothetical protein
LNIPRSKEIYLNVKIDYTNNSRKIEGQRSETKEEKYKNKNKIKIKIKKSENKTR